MTAADHQAIWAFGRTPSFASQADPRFSYWLHVPRCYPGAVPAHRSMLVAMHGTDRNAPLLRGLFEEFSERFGVLVVVPHFPGGIGDPQDVDAYKYIRALGVNYDEALLHIVDEVAARYGCQRDKFLMFGFSGGAHFAHRFWYLYPERLRAVAVAAPGSVTLPTQADNWWVGIKDTQQRFGRKVDFVAMSAVPALLLVGSDDTSTEYITHVQTSPYWMEGANAAGRTRVERLRTLHGALHTRGIEATLRELPGVTHQYAPLVAATADFFANAVKELQPLD